MNPVVMILFCSALLVTVLALPLIRGRVMRNSWYGIRIPAAFESEAAWLDINRYGGRLFLTWGLGIAVTALIGVFLPRVAWVAFDWASLVVIMLGLVSIVVLIYRRGPNPR